MVRRVATDGEGTARRGIIGFRRTRRRSPATTQGTTFARRKALLLSRAATGRGISANRTAVCTRGPGFATHVVLASRLSRSRLLRPLGGTGVVLIFDFCGALLDPGAPRPTTVDRAA